MELPGTIVVVERYRSPLGLAFIRPRKDIPVYVSNRECMQMAVHALNCTVGTGGRFLELFVFGDIAQPVRKYSAPKQLQRENEMETAMEDVAREQSRHRIANKMCHRRGEKAR